MASECPDRQITLQVRMLTEGALNDARFDRIKCLASEIIAYENPLGFGALLELRQVGQVHRAKSDHRDGAWVRTGQVFPRAVIGGVFGVHIERLADLKFGSIHSFLESFVTVDQDSQTGRANADYDL